MASPEAVAVPDNVKPPHDAPLSPTSLLDPITRFKFQQKPKGEVQRDP